MKLFITIGGFIPAKNYGGPVVSICNFCELLKNEFEIYIITVDHDINSKQRFHDIAEGWNDLGYAKVMYLKDNEISKANIEKIVNEIKPDILYANSLFLAKFVIPLYIISKKNNIPLLIAPRGELCKQPYSVKKVKKKLYNFLIRTIFKKVRAFYQATSEEERQEIKRILNVDEKKILYLDNIPSIPNSKFKKNNKEKDSLKCIFISRIHPKKNLLYALQILGDVKSKIIFDIYGNIEDYSYWENCEKLIKTMPSNIEVSYMGTVNHNEIFSTFSKYDIFLFPTKSENYGHVIVEAMASSCPVVISDQTPWNEINNCKAGWAIELDNKSEFVKALETLAAMNDMEYIELVQRCENYIEQKLKVTELKKEYTTAFRNLSVT